MMMEQLDKEEKRIFNLLIKHDELTENLLIAAGYSKENIKFLVKKNILRKLPRKQYDICDYDAFFQYGRYIEGIGQNAQAAKCFVICEENDPNTIKRKLKKIYSLISERDNITESTLCQSGMSLREINTLYRLGYIKKAHRQITPLVDLDLRPLKDDSADEKANKNPRAITPLERRIFNLYIETESLYKPLMKKSLTQSEIKRAFTNGVITSVSRSYYKILNLERLYLYAQELRDRGNEEAADKCCLLYERNRPERLDEDMKKFYNLLPTYPILTENSLQTHGFDKAKIEALLSNGRIKRSNNFFFPADKTAFLSFIEQLKKEGKTRDAEICLSVYNMYQKEPNQLDEQMQVLYELIADNKRLKLDIIAEKGLSAQEISILNKKRILKKENNDTYALINYDGLLEYATELEQSGQIEKAYNCYAIFVSEYFKKRCSVTDGSLFYKTCLKMIVYYFNQSEYEKAFHYLKYFQSDEIYEGQFNYYVYLFSFIIKLPESFRNLAKNVLSSEVEDSIFETHMESSSFIENLFAQKFARALSQLESADIDRTLPQYILTHSLLVSIVEKDKALKRTIKNAIIQSDTERICIILSREYMMHKMTTEYMLILDIAANIEKCKRGEPISCRPVAKRKSLVELIFAKRYAEALARHRAILEEKNVSTGRDYIYMLLDLAVKTIEESQSTEKTKPKLERNTKHNDVPQIEDDLNYISKLLRAKEISSAEIAIDKLLTNMRKTSYRYLVFALVNISYKTRDFSFKGPIGTLKKLTSDDYSVNIDFYKHLFDECMNKQEYDIAELYIDLIKEVIDHGHDDLPDDTSLSILAEMQKKYKAKSHIILPKTDKPGQNS